MEELRLEKSEIGGKRWTLSFTSPLSYSSLMNALNSSLHVLGQTASPWMNPQAVSRYVSYTIKVYMRCIALLVFTAIGEPAQSTALAVRA